MRLFLCLSLSLRTRISETTRAELHQLFSSLCMSTVAVSRYSSGGTILPVLWMTSCCHIMAIERIRSTQATCVCCGRMVQCDINDMILTIYSALKSGLKSQLNCRLSQKQKRLMSKLTKKLSRCRDSATYEPSDAEIVGTEVQNYTFSILHWSWYHRIPRSESAVACR